VGVQEVGWDKGGTVRAGDYICFYGKGNENHQLGTEFFVRHRTVSAVKRVEFVSDRISYALLPVFCFTKLIQHKIWQVYWEAHKNVNILSHTKQNNLNCHSRITNVPVHDAMKIKTEWNKMLILV